MGNKVAVVSFMRAQPPSVGHRAVVNTVIEQGKTQAQSADVQQVSLYVLVSQKHDSKKNPLPPKFREELLSDLIDARVHTSMEKHPRTLIEAMTLLDEQGFTDVVVVVGSDRVAEFQDLLDKYNNKPDKQGRIVYAFDSINVMQAGDAREATSELDPDDPANVAAVSATALRKAAADNNFDLFKQGFYDPDNTELARKTFKELQTQMNIDVPEDVEDDDGVEPIEEPIGDVEADRVAVTETARNAALSLRESHTPFKTYKSPYVQTEASINDDGFVRLDVRMRADGGTLREYAMGLAEGITVAANISKLPLDLPLQEAKGSDLINSIPRGAIIREALRRLPVGLAKRVCVRKQN